MTTMRAITRALTIFLCAAATTLHAQPLADRVPADAMLYVGWAGTDALKAQYDQSKLKAVMDSAQIQKLLTEQLPQLASVTEDPDFRAFLDAFNVVAEPTWRRPFALFVSGELGVDQHGKPAPKFAMLWDMPDAAAATAFSTKLGEMSKDAKSASPIGITTHQTIAVMTIGYADAATAVASNAKTISRSTAFLAASKHIDPNAALVVYASGERVLQLIDDAAKDEAEPEDLTRWAVVRDALGLDGIKQIGFSAGFDGQDWATRAFIDAPAPRKGLAALLDVEPKIDEQAHVVSWHDFLRYAQQGAFKVAVTVTDNRIVGELKDGHAGIPTEWVAPYRVVAKISPQTKAYHISQLDELKQSYTQVNGASIDELLKLMPRTATWLSASRFDVQKVMALVRAVAKVADEKGEANLDRGLAMAKQTTGIDIEKDVIAPMGDAWVFYSDPAVAGIGGMGICAVHVLDDPAAMEATIIKLEAIASDRLAHQAERGGMKMVIQTFDMGGVKVHSLVLPFFSPSWAVHDGKLYAAIFPQAIQTAAMYAKGGQPTILDNEKFVAVRQQLGATGESSLMFSDLPLTAPATYQSYMMLTQMATGLIAQQTGKAPAIMLPPLGLILPHLSPAGSAGWVDATGYHYRGTSPFPGASLLSPQGGMSMTNVSAVSLGAGITLPALGAARRTAQQMQSSTQARGIHQSMITYAQGNNQKLPDDIAVLVEGNYFTPEYAISPMSGKSIPGEYLTWAKAQQHDWLRRNASYILVPNLTDDIDTEKIAVFGRPDDHRGGIPVTRNDNSTQWEPNVDAVKAKLKAQTGKTMDELIARQEALAKTTAPPAP